MSGGVDSTVTALLLQKEGFVVRGVYMKLHDKPGYHEANFERVQRVGEHLGIEVSMLDLSREFAQAVYEPFVQSYREGRTPNPCAVCNRKIKFGALLEYADEIGVDFVATGHYARHDDETILEAVDETKDQSYFLFDIDKRVLPRILFPLGNWRKSDVKAFAATIPALSGFAEQQESSEICFVETTYIDILRRHCDVDQPGEVLDVHGNVVGEHQGYMHYTIGKRRGFRVQGALEPHYVQEILPGTNQIVVGKHAQLATSEVLLEWLNLITDARRFDADVKVRYRTRRIPCTVEILGGGRARLLLKEPVYGVAVGQAAVLYQGVRVLGGGWICG